MVAGGPRRRAVLAGGAALALTACRPGSDNDQEQAVARQVARVRHRARLAAESTALAQQYAVVTQAFPAAAAELGRLAAEHEAHAAALLPPAAARWLRRHDPASSSSTPPTSPSGAPPPVPPASLGLARAGLAAAERAAARRRSRAARDAEPALARLLASIAACHAVHAALLEAAAA